MKLSCTNQTRYVCHVKRLQGVLLCAAVAGSRAAGAIPLSGQVKNGSANNTPVAGVVVSLYSHGVHGQPAAVAETKTDSAGKFRFDIKPEPAKSSDSHPRHFVVSVSHQRAIYESRPEIVRADHPPHPVTLTVYDTTTDSSKVSVHMHHVMLDPGGGEEGSETPETWRVQEIVTLLNSGKETYIGSNKDSSGTTKTAQFSLPKGFKNFKTREGWTSQPLVTDDGVFDATPISPGGKTYVLEYELAAKTLRGGWRRIVDYPTMGMGVFAIGKDINLSGEGFSKQRTEEMMGKKVTFINGENLAPGKEVVVKIGAPSLKTSQAPLVIGVLVGLAAILGIGVARMRSGKKTPPSKPKKASASREALLDQIADLDDQFDEGKIAEEAYKKKRAELKKRLAG